MTNDIEKRFKEHNAGRVSSTKQMVPLELINVEICLSRKEARKLEKFYKSGFGREIIKELFS